ncbi:MAG TPA: ribose-5-phosphate isomerase [Streptomyces sp.]|nr:ribose-5-phosphate isomerase [Streptomyces sp.]
MPGTETVRIAVAADHNGIALKARLVAWLRAHGHDTDDRGAHRHGEVVDYPPLCADACRRVVDGSADRAIVIGGSGHGEVIACNKIRGVRAGLCRDLWGAEISRGNNDSNVLVLGAKVVPPQLAEQILATWLATPFKGDVHQRRLDQIAALERGEDLARQPHPPLGSAGGSRAPGSGATSACERPAGEPQS